MLNKGKLLALLLILSCKVFCQNIDSIYHITTKKIEKLSHDTTFILDKKIVLPQSINIFDKNGNEINDYEFDINTSRLKLKSNLEAITIKYKTIDIYKDNQPLSIKIDTTFDKNKEKTIQKKTFYFQPKESSILDLNTLDYSGNFSRGFVVGSNQDVSTISSFDFVAKGQLSNGLDIEANITDDNILIQPSGTSTTIHNFDKILVKLKKDNSEFQIGDIHDNNSIENYFLNYQKALQGIKFNSNINLLDDKKLSFGAMLSIAKGSFAINNLKVEERNQGPYRLEGNNNETNIIIIAGSEKVYINGTLIKRGSENEYIMDYNTAEISFTTKRLITKDLRIYIEFQYSDKNFSRYSISNYVNYKTPKVELYSLLFGEIDNKNQPINQNFDSSQIAQIKGAGNNVENLFVSSHSATVYDSTAIQYKKIDTIIDGKIYSEVFEHNEEMKDSLYNLKFVYKGENKGNYTIKESSYNGTIYQWIAPKDGIMQGEYEAQIKIITPKNHIQYVLGAKTKIFNTINHNIESSISLKDQNTYSSIDNNQNIGMSILNRLIYNKNLKNGDSLSLNSITEYSSTYFNPINRIYNPETNRNWGISDDKSINDFIKTDIGFSLKNNKKSISNLLRYIKFQNKFNIIENEFDYRIRAKKINLAVKKSLMINKNYDSFIYFLRPNIFIDYIEDSTLLKKHNLFISFFGEYKKVENNKSSSISFNNIDNATNISIGDNIKFQNSSYRFNYIYRTEQKDIDTSKSNSHTFSIEGNLSKNKIRYLDYSITYRKYLKTINNIDNINTDNALALINLNKNFFKNRLNIQNTLEIKSAKEPKTQISYIKATNTLGNYAWKDLNNNNIFDLNEAYISYINTENIYIKYFSHLPSYISSNLNTNTLNLSFSPKIENPKNKLYSTINNMTVKHLSELQNKTLWDDFELYKLANPIPNNKSIGSKVFFSNSIMYTILNSRLNIDFNWNHLDISKTLIYGNDREQKKYFSLTSNYRFSDNIEFSSKLLNGTTTVSSTFFEENNFKYIENGVSLSTNITANKIFTFGLEYQYNYKSNNQAFCVQNNFGTEAKLTIGDIAYISSQVNIKNISWQQTERNNYFQLYLLGSFAPGLNILSNNNFNITFNNFLNININYNIRKSENSELNQSIMLESKIIF